MRRNEALARRDEFLGGASRPSMAVGAIAIGVLSAWMFWIVHTFLDGRGWFDLIVGHILEEVIFTADAFAVLLLIWALFAPNWLTRILNAAYHKLAHTIAWLGLLFAASVFLLTVVLPLVFWAVGLW